MRRCENPRTLSDIQDLPWNWGELWRNPVSIPFIIDINGLMTYPDLLGRFKKVPMCDHCCICLEDNVVGGLESPCCKQTTCTDCITNWLKVGKSCPTCRGNLN